MGYKNSVYEKKDIQQFAKKYALIDLHLHLDGSLSPEAVIYMAKKSGVSLITEDKSKLEKLLMCPDNCENLNDYLKCFDLPIQVMQTEDAISYSVYDLVKRLDAQGLLYAEIRFAPQLHTQKGLSQEQVVEAAIQGLESSLKESDMDAQLILCCMRGDGNDEENMETIRMAKKYLSKGVAACDLAGAEALFKTEKYKDLFEYASKSGVPYTIHAGEADGVSSVELAVAYGAKRIGHGIRTYNDSTAKKNLVKNNITLELCPTSNMNTKAVYEIDTIDKYPVHEFVSANVKVTVNTDNMTVSNTTVEKEFYKLFEHGVIDQKDAVMLVHNAVSAAFLSDDKKKELWDKCNNRIKIVNNEKKSIDNH